MIGELRLAIAETTDLCCDERYDFVHDYGVIENVCNEAECPLNTEVLAVFEGARLVNYERTLKPALYANTTVKNMAMVWAVDAEEDITPALKDRVARDAKEFEHWVRLLSEEEWEVNCTPYVVVDNYQSRDLFYSFSRVRDQMEAQHPGMYDQHNYFCIRGGWKTGLNGEAYLNTGKLAVYLTGTLRTIVHEFIHCTGRSHSTSPGQEYGDKVCVMAQAWTNLNPHHLINLGLVTEDKVKTITSSAQAYLVPLETWDRDVRHGECRTLRVEYGGERYYLSTRLTKDMHYAGVRDMESKGSIFVHSPVGFWNSTRSVYWTEIREGQDAMLDAGIYVKNEGQLPSGANVCTVKINGEKPDFVPEPQPLPVMEGIKPTSHLSAIWYDARYKHQGFDFTIFPETNGQFQGYWFMYHPRGEHLIKHPIHHESRDFLVLDGNRVGNHIEFRVLQTHPDKDDVVVGRGTLRFDDEDSGFIRLTTTTHGRQSFFLTRLSRRKVFDELTGIYETGTREGFSVSSFGEGKYAAYYFGYGVGQRTWYVVLGDKAGAKRHTVTSLFRSTHEGKIVSEISPGIEGNKIDGKAVEPV